MFIKKWFSQLAGLPKGCVVNWGDQVKPFLFLWLAYLTCNGVTIPNNMSKPSGLAISKWVVSYYLRWPDSKISQVDDHVFAVLGKQAGSQRGFSSLTPAEQ